MTTTPSPVAAWHAVVESRDATQLAELLADDVVFRSPAVHTRQEGRERASAYLAAAMVVLGPTVRYRREWYAEDSAVLEFEAELDGLSVHGVDMIRWNEAGKLVEFTVMVRPMRGLQHLITLMGNQLSAANPRSP